jgi:integrase
MTFVAMDLSEQTMEADAAPLPKTRLYAVADGTIGRWKNPATGRWENKRVPKDEDDPESWFLAWIHERLAEGAATGQTAKKRSTTIRLLVPRWQKHKLSLAGADPRKIKPTCSCILRYAGPLLDVPLDEMTVPKVAAWVDGLQRSGRAPFTVRNIIQAHRSLVIDARGMGWVDLKENPFADPYVRGKLKGIAPKAGKDVIVALPLDEALKLIAYDKTLIPDGRKVLNLLAMVTGMRLAEVAAVSWRDIKDDNTLTVFRQLDRGGFKPAFKSPKLGSRRVIPLHPLAVRALAWWKKHSRNVAPDDPIFPGKFGFYGFATSAKTFREDLVAAGVGAGFDPGDGQRVRYTFHALRRTFASLLEESGVPREQICGLMGHGAKGVTDRNYIRKSLKRYQDAIAALPVPGSVPWIEA